MRRVTQIVVILLVAFVAVGVRAFVVRAHADYERSEPAADAVVAAAPEQVRVWFTQELFRREGENRLEVYGPDGERMDLDDAAIADDDRTLMTVSLSPDLPDGVYTVRWHTLSAEDGHPGDGEFSFTVGESDSPTVEATAATETEDPGASEAATATPELPAETPTTVPTAAPAADSSPALPCLGSAAIMLFALGVVLVGRQRSEHEW